jgi:hypothetical protein
MKHSITALFFTFCYLLGAVLLGVCSVLSFKAHGYLLGVVYAVLSILQLHLARGMWRKYKFMKEEEAIS